MMGKAYFLYYFLLIVDRTKEAARLPVAGISGESGGRLSRGVPHFHGYANI